VADKPASILLIEDNSDHAEMVTRLARTHFDSPRIDHVTNGEAALNYLFQRSPYSDLKRYPTPHLVLLDLRLPKVDGLDVLRQIKATDELRRVPVVVLTTSDAEDDVAAACRLHANSYLVKPPDLGAFDELMHATLTYWLEWHRSAETPTPKNGSRGHSRTERRR
jgi:CheY-like chemotaxis protein